MVEQYLPNLTAQLGREGGLKRIFNVKQRRVDPKLAFCAALPAMNMHRLETLVGLEKYSPALDQ